MSAQQPRHTSVNRHGVVVALEDDDLDLLQVSSFLIVNSRCKFQGLNLHLGLKHIPLICCKNLTLPKAERDQRCPRLVVVVVFYLF